MFVSFFLPSERNALIAEAIAEAKKHGRQQSIARVASIQRTKTGELTSGQVVGRLFKKPTKSARRQGEARLVLDDMVRRAERKLAEAERQNAGVQTAEEKVESLAKELYHTPGSMLTSEEIALMTQESECGSIRETPFCFKNLYNVFVRTIDGTCNNLKNPLFGASETPFARIVPPFYEDGISSLRGDLQAKTGNVFSLSAFGAPAPSARLISKTLIFRNDSREENDFTHLLMQWGQFLDHDLDLSPELEADCEHCEFTEICRPIHVPEEDPVFGVGTLQNGDCLRFARSLPACSQDPPGTYSPQEQLNGITAFIDASNVYGSNSIIGNAVRAFEDGLLKEGDPALLRQKPALPIDEDDIVACLNRQNCFLAGDVRANEQIALTITHTVWFREHNRIARALKEINPFWNDERLFQETRMIIGALIQKITYEDYLPKVMGPTVFNELIGPYDPFPRDPGVGGYDPRINPAIPNSFATAAYRYGHSLVRPEFARLNSNYRPLVKGPLNLVDAFFNPGQFRTSMGTDPILRGLVTEQPLKLDTFINFNLNSRLFERADKGIAGMDLAALNIQRGRDHGLPPLPVFAEFCREKFPFLPRRSEFEKEIDTIRFLELHGSLNEVDPWIGGIAERRLDGSFLGPTFACIFAITFSNVRNGDRFWYEKPGVFSPAQRREIRRGSISRVICNSGDNINRIQRDAFLSNQSRVSCDRIPQVDLMQWKEEPCFVRVEVEPMAQDIALQIFSQFGSFGINSFFEEVQAAQEPQFVCMPVTCPLPGTKGTRIIFSTDKGDTVTVTKNAALAKNQIIGRDDRYRAVWPPGAFDDSTSNGVFKSREACENGDMIAFDLAMQTDAVKKLDVALSQQSTDEDIKDFVEFFQPDDEDSGDGGAGEEAEKEASDQALTAELEEALKSLGL